MINIFVGFVIVTFQSEGEADFKNCPLGESIKHIALILSVFYNQIILFVGLKKIDEAAYSAYKKLFHTKQMTNDRPVYIYHWSIKLYTGLSLVICIV